MVDCVIRYVVVWFWRAKFVLWGCVVQHVLVSMRGRADLVIGSLGRAVFTRATFMKFSGNFSADRFSSLPTPSTGVWNRSHTRTFERTDFDLFTGQMNPAASIDNSFDLVSAEKLPESYS